MSVNEIKEILNDRSSFIEKKRKLKSLQISNTVEQLEISMNKTIVDEKTVKYLKRKLKRQKLEMSKLWC